MTRNETRMLLNFYSMVSGSHLTIGKAAILLPPEKWLAAVRHPEVPQCCDIIMPFGSSKNGNIIARYNEEWVNIPVRDLYPLAGLRNAGDAEVSRCQMLLNHVISMNDGIIPDEDILQILQSERGEGLRNALFAYRICVCTNPAQVRDAAVDYVAELLPKILDGAE